MFAIQVIDFKCFQPDFIRIQTISRPPSGLSNRAAYPGVLMDPAGSNSGDDFQSLIWIK